MNIFLFESPAKEFVTIMTSRRNNRKDMVFWLLGVNTSIIKMYFKYIFKMLQNLRCTSQHSRFIHQVLWRKYISYGMC
jgi:hypothetical protein